jgi:hypothetical protein
MRVDCVLELLKGGVVMYENWVPVKGYVLFLSKVQDLHDLRATYENHEGPLPKYILPRDQERNRVLLKYESEWLTQWFFTPRGGGGGSLAGQACDKN